MFSTEQLRIIEDANFSYSPLGNEFEKQIKTIAEQGEKQIKVLQSLDSKYINHKISFKPGGHK